LIAAVLSPVETLRAFGIVLGAVGLAICGLVRDRGRDLQSRLWADWGGSPTVQRLRWRGADNTRRVARLHERVNAVLPRPLPERDEEATDPQDADARYEEAVAIVRDRTRDTSRFRLIFEENKEYGYRRNALGIRPFGLTIASIALAVTVVAFALDDAGLTSRLVRWGGCAAVAAVALAFWWRVVTEDWVKRSAEIYADRLLESVETLRQNH
jgi:hypothetical protein